MRTDRHRVPTQAPEFFAFNQADHSEKDAPKIPAVKKYFQNGFAPLQFCEKLILDFYGSTLGKPG
ncbi:hypothetical protein [Rhodospirillum sp. A1_3_36]|uniref:hypothetical protein n=1 Tax=Rhodospirillum sp. A1_3_36 TaxID=3391666 RepID=UPI0039A54194